jgi:hypothetical protein
MKHLASLTLMLVTAAAYSPSTATAVESAGVLGLTVQTPLVPPDPEQVKDPDDPFWQSVGSQRLTLHRSPALRAGSSRDQNKRPDAFVQFVQLPQDKVAVRLAWTDSTDNRPLQGKALRDRGEWHTYKARGHPPDEFADAACLMVPQARGHHESYPSLIMGDKDNPVDLYFWKAGKTFEHLTATGRGTSSRDQQQVAGASRRHKDSWAVVMIVPELTTGTPISFALWNGQQKQRDGLKYFSLWYEVQQ